MHGLRSHTGMSSGKAQGPLGEGLQSSHRAVQASFMARAVMLCFYKMSPWWGGAAGEGHPEAFVRLLQFLVRL